ncbi:MAG TPA: DUF2304 domain-containing protein [Bryobacteraceae bacterium]|nr:DUF2304 domain-containing protein [Bryobacteraceae bacterium]
MNYHPLLVALGLAIVIVTLTSLRREHIRTEYSVSWLLLGVILTAFASFPNGLERLSGAFGLQPTVGFSILGGILVAALTFEISHVVSRLRDENVMLAQRLAILEYRIQQFDKQDRGATS